MTATLAEPLAVGVQDWNALAARARTRRRTKEILLYTFMAIGALPILVPYLWLVTVAFSGRMGASTFVLWRTLAVVLPALFLWSLLRLSLESGRLLRVAEISLGLATIALLAVLTGPYLHLDNWRFLWNPDIADALKGASGTGAKFPSVWTAFGNSLLLATVQMLIVVSVATLAGYYLSRFDFHGRSELSQGAARPARLSGDDADHPDLPDAVLDRPPRHADRRHPGRRRA